MRTITDKLFRKVACLLAITMLLAFALSDILRSKSSDASYLNSLPAPNKILRSSSLKDEFNLQGFKINPTDPYKLEFIFEKPYAVSDESLQELKQRIISYFFAALTVPSEKLWVNLSPYEQNRVVDTELANTALGVDMLAQDYVLKQLSASLTAPGTKLGKEYWKQLQLNNLKSDIGKIWIKADRADYFIGENTVMLGKAALKVEAENDESLILPKLEEQVNQGQHFSKLRQIYNAVLLSHVFKQHLKISHKSKPLLDTSIEGVANLEKYNKNELYNLYLKAYRKGVYDVNLKTKIAGQAKNMNYFSGGVAISSSLTDYNVYHIDDFPMNQNNSYESVLVELQRNVSSALTGKSKDVYRDSWSGFSRDVDILRADLEVCIAVAAYNEETKERRLVHVFPAKAYANAQENNDFSVGNSVNSLGQIANYDYAVNDRVRHEKVKVLMQMLGFLEKDSGWKIVVVGSDDAHNRSVADKFIVLSDVINFTKNRLNVKADDMVVDSRETYKVVQYAKNGELHINYVNRLSDYKDQEPNRVIDFLKDASQENQAQNIKQEIDWGLKHDEWIEGVKLKRFAKVKGYNEIKISLRNFGNSSDLRVAQYLNKEWVARQMSKSELRRLKKLNYDQNIIMDNVFEAIKLLDEHVKKTGEIYILEKPRYALKLIDGTPLFLSEKYSGVTSLKDFLNGIKENKEKLSPAESIEILSGIYRALSWAHSAGVRHNDIGVSNVAFNSEAKLLLGDLGAMTVASPSDHFAFMADLERVKIIASEIDALTEDVYQYSDELNEWKHYRDVAFDMRDRVSGFTVDDDGLSFSEYMVSLGEEKLKNLSSSSLNKIASRVRRIFMTRERAWYDKWLDSNDTELAFNFSLEETKEAPTFYTYTADTVKGAKVELYFDSQKTTMNFFLSKNAVKADFVLNFVDVEKQFKRVTKLNVQGRPRDHRYRQQELATTNVTINYDDEEITFGDKNIGDSFEFAVDKGDSTISMAISKRMHHKMASNRFFTHLREDLGIELVEKILYDYVIIFFIFPDSKDKQNKVKGVGGIDLDINNAKIDQLLREFVVKETPYYDFSAQITGFKLLDYKKTFQNKKNMYNKDT